METPFYFNGIRTSLFGIKHSPSGDKKNIGLVFCHPFAEEKLWSHRVFVNMARDLAKNGYPVLRFDYSGYGDSDGRFEECTLYDHANDIKAAIAELKNAFGGISSIGLIGLRYGATLAALVAEEDISKTISHLVMIDPVVDMESYMQEVLRANLTTQMIIHGKIVTTRDELTKNIMDGDAVNIDGYDITRSLYESVCVIKLNNIQKTYAGKSLIIQIGRQNQSVRKELEQLTASYAEATLILVTEEPFWRELKNYIQRTESISMNMHQWIEGQRHD